MKTSLGQKLKEIRTMNHFTQEQIAEYLGIDQSYIAKMETDEREIGLSILKKISELFGCSINCFYEDCTKQPIKIAYRANNIEKSDLDIIAKIQRIALNLREMDELMKE